MQGTDFVLIYEVTVLTADGKPAARTNSLEGRRETDLKDKPLDGRRETDQQADNAGASERETQRCPNRLRRARRETELTNTGTWSVASRNRGLLRF